MYYCRHCNKNVPKSQVNNGNDNIARHTICAVELVKNPCCLCLAETSEWLIDEQIPQGRFVIGRRYSFHHERLIVFRGYLCDSCIDHVMERRYRFA